MLTRAPTRPRARNSRRLSFPPSAAGLPLGNSCSNRSRRYPPAAANGRAHWAAFRRSSRLFLELAGSLTDAVSVLACPLAAARGLDAMGGGKGGRATPRLDVNGEGGKGGQRS